MRPGHGGTSLAMDQAMPTLRPEVAHRFDAARHLMIEAHLKTRGITDRQVLHAMAGVPRELFVPRHLAIDAYADVELELEHARGQLISSPYVVATMIQALCVQARDRVLEIGTGSGYTAAVLSQLARHVCTIECLPELAMAAETRLIACGYRGIDVMLGDGMRGWPEHSPYDCIIVSGSVPAIPRPLIAQLALGGRLVMPLARDGEPLLVRITRAATQGLVMRELHPIRIDPLLIDETTTN